MSQGKYRYTFSCSGAAAVLATFLSVPYAAPLYAITIMPMGDSITRGVDYETNTLGGYRDPLYSDLNGAFPFSFTGVDSSLSTSQLVTAGDQLHDGFGSWHVADLNANLDGVAAPIAGGDSNDGGYLLTGGHGTGRAAICPGILLLHAGTNDILQDNQNLYSDLQTLVTHVHALCPATIELVAAIIPINSAGFLPIIQAYNTYIKSTLVPSLAYTRFVDQYTPFTNADGTVNGTLIGTDNIHPNKYGYPIMAATWAAAIKAVVGLANPSYGLTVVNGSIQTPAGSVVAVTAVPAPPGYQFAGWTGATFTNPAQRATTLIMPATALTISATYTAIPATYTLTVVNGVGSGSYAAGAKVTVTANTPAAGYQFASWTGATSGLANPAAASTVLTMTGAPAVITATYFSPAGSSLGVFALLDEVAATGNSLGNDFGLSYEGNNFTTYWFEGNNVIRVQSMGTKLYELIETTGGRCLTVNGSTLSMTSCTQSPQQLLALTLQKDGSYVIAASNGNCLAAPQAFGAVNAQPCSTAINQRWQFAGSAPLLLP